MNYPNSLFVAFSLFILSLACNSPQQNTGIAVISNKINLPPAVFHADSLLMGETIYIPLYSDIYILNENRKLGLTSTLSIRNTDISYPIYLKIIDYFNTEGKRIRTYLDTPVTLNPLQTTEIVVAHEDNEGGSGANFIVEWVSDKEVSSPIMESIMINTYNGQGISFTSQGKVVRMFKK